MASFRSACRFSRIGSLAALLLVTGPHVVIAGLSLHDPDDAPVNFLAAREPCDAEAIVAKALRAASGSQRGALSLRREALEAKLRPLFLVLPKAPNGRLAPETVRYALHRHFVREYSAYIHGLEPTEGFWNSSLATDALSRLPVAQELFEESLESRGFDLHKLALFAATLESLIHDDAVVALREAYTLHNHSTEELLDDIEIEDVIKRFMILFLSFDHQKHIYRKIAFSHIQRFFPGWNKVAEFLLQKQWEVLGSNDRGHAFADVVRLLDAVVASLGSQQQADCDDFTDELIKSEVPGTGRVKLSNFYKTRMMDEPPGLLRGLGALDEEEGDVQKEPHLLIANYIASSTNCVSATNLYAICCPDACEPLLTQLELQVGGPLAAPAQILELVEAMPSRTEPAPRRLGEALAARLREIAAVNGGSVPLHGRLFAQWMHLAYPHECQLPARLGSTMNVASKDLQRTQRGREVFDARKAEDYLRDHASAKDLEGGDLASTVLWQTEELTFVHSHSAPARPVLALVRCIAFAGAVCAAAWLALRSAASPTASSKPRKDWLV